MTLMEGEKVAGVLADAYLDGRELVVELTGQPVVYTGLYSRRFTEDLVYADQATGHYHRTSEITIKGVKRGDLL